PAPRISSSRTTTLRFSAFCFSFMNYPQWVVDAVRVSRRPHAERQLPVASTQKTAHWLLGTGYWVLLLVLMRRRLSQINAGEQHKNVRLNKRHADMQALENNRNTQRHQRKKYQRNHLAREHVREKTDRQRQDASRMTEQLNREQQDRQEQPDSQRHALLRPDKMLQVSNRPICPQTLEVIVKPREQRAAQRHYRHRCGRFQARHQSNQI